MAQDDSARDRDPMARRVARAEEVLEAGLLGKFMERLHPRDRRGKFSHSLGMTAGERAKLESKYDMQGKRAAAAGPSKHALSRADELKAAHDVATAHPSGYELDRHTTSLSPERRATLKSALEEDEGTHAITTPATHAAIKRRIAFHDQEDAADARDAATREPARLPGEAKYGQRPREVNRAAQHEVRPARNPKFDESSKGLMRGESDAERIRREAQYEGHSAPGPPSGIPSLAERSRRAKLADQSVVSGALAAHNAGKLDEYLGNLNPKQKQYLSDSLDAHVPLEKGGLEMHDAVRTKFGKAGTRFPQEFDAIKARHDARQATRAGRPDPRHREQAALDTALANLRAIPDPMKATTVELAQSADRIAAIDLSKLTPEQARAATAKLAAINAQLRRIRGRQS